MSHYLTDCKLLWKQNKTFPVQCSLADSALPIMQKKTLKTLKCNFDANVHVNFGIGELKGKNNIHVPSSSGSKVIYYV